MLGSAVQELKQTIAEHDGSNAAAAPFARRVDELISAFYDDIGEITTVPTRTLFDLFVIKVLYVERRSVDAGVVDYLGGLLERYLYTRELFSARSGGRISLPYLSDLLREMQERTRVQNLFEAFRRYGDTSLFVTGMFPRALEGRRRRSTASFVDREYYVTSGKRFYHLAAEHELAEFTQQRELLEKLATYFEIYTEALNEVSQRYVMGFDLHLIADKMLDSFNRYRSTGDEKSLENARRYAAILKLSEESFPSLLRPRVSILKRPPQA